MAPDSKLQGFSCGSLKFLIVQFQAMQVGDDQDPALQPQHLLFLHVSSWRTCFENSLYAAVEINHGGDCAEEIPPSPSRLSLVTPTPGRTSQGKPGQKGTACYLLTRPFSFQSPASMKSVLQAGWLLTVAVGNTLVLVVAQAAPMAQVWFGS